MNQFGSEDFSRKKNNNNPKRTIKHIKSGSVCRTDVWWNNFPKFVAKKNTRKWWIIECSKEREMLIQRVGKHLRQCHQVYKQLIISLSADQLHLAQMETKQQQIIDERREKKCDWIHFIFIHWWWLHGAIIRLCECCCCCWMVNVVLFEMKFLPLGWVSFSMLCFL